MTRERKILLILLELTALALIYQVGMGRLRERRSDLEEKISLNNQLIDREAKRESREKYPHQDEVISLYASFDKERDIYSFGRVMKGLFEENGIVLSRYREIESTDSRELEYQLEGNSSSFMSLLHSLNSPEARTSITSLRISSEETGLSATLRLAPALLPKGVEAPPATDSVLTSGDTGKVYHYAPGELAGLFPRVIIPSRPRTTVNSTAPVVTSAAPRAFQGKISFIGQVRADGGKLSYCFKYQETGEIILLAPDGETNRDGWSLKEESERAYLIQRNTELYEVYK